jgi:hypothetical protein
MKIGKFTFLLIVTSLAIIAISACTPSRIPVEEYDRIATSVPTTAPETVEEVAPESGEQAEPAPVEQGEESPGDDVPIMEAGYQVQKSRSGNNITYQVDGTIEDVMTFYQEELPNYNWEMAGPPDNAVANIATILRENATGDRLAINMQYNELGNFVRLSITISRAN